MNEEIKEEWVAALESGDYKQGIGCLRDSYNSYCCLGVLSDLAVKKGIAKWTYTGLEWLVSPIDESSSGSAGLLPGFIAKWAEFDYDDVDPDADGIRLSTYNDSGADFENIANLIKEHM